MRQDGEDRKNREFNFADCWAAFLDQFRSQEAALIRELSACWSDLSRVVPVPVPGDLSAALGDFKPQSIGAYLELRREAARVLLLDPASRIQRMRPLRRAAMAVETYERNLENRLEDFPEQAVINGPDVLGAVAPLIRPGPILTLAGLRRRRKVFPLRGIVKEELHRLGAVRSPVEGACFLAFHGAIRQGRNPWESARSLIDACVAGGGEGGVEDLRKAFEPGRRRLEAILAEGEDALAARRRLSGDAELGIAAALASCVALRSRRTIRSDRARASAGLPHWAAQSRALESETRLEISLESCEGEILDSCRRSVESAAEELGLLMRELGSTIAWLEGQIENRGRDDFPPPTADIVPAASRLAELEEALRGALKTLPESCETLRRFSALPHSQGGLRILRPRQIYHESFLRSGKDPISRILEKVTDEHRRIVQELERARQVVRFARESASSADDTSLVVEAHENARSLLTFRRDQRSDWIAAADAGIAGTIAGVLNEARLMLSRRRLGVSAHVARHGARRAAVMLSESAAAGGARALRFLKRGAEGWLNSLLVRIGWRALPLEGKLEVITRPFLPQEFTVDLATKELPALYRRLFRFEPVQDPRFLVGREREMAAIEEARSLWESGRKVAMIIVGERGSGKTSLINCALKRCLRDVEVVRTEFARRILSAAEMRSFLAGALGVADPDRLEQTLADRRRVIILEELERCYLRQVGYYRAIRELQRLIAATCTTTLWILATNEIAFQLLHPAVDLGQTFSHRINAGTATRVDLRQAILLRHDLSGLRLQFAPPAQPGRLADRLRQGFHDHRDPESEFFESLSRESAGVYRSAFDIWLGHIEGAHAGILYMKKIELPDLSHVIDDLTQEDLFTLLAIPQHGGLTAEEHATIFQKTVAASRAQLDGLLAREIIEPEPGRPGLRVRPEAMRIVREALYRRNLI